MGGNRVSEEGFVPEDTDCFRSDAVLLTKKALSGMPYNYTSNSISIKVGRSVNVVIYILINIFKNVIYTTIYKYIIIMNYILYIIS